MYISGADSISSQNNYFLLGGFESVNWRSVPMIGYRANEVPVKMVAGFGAELDCEIFEKIHLSFSLKVAEIQHIEYNKEYSFLAGYGIGVGYLSLIGPLKIGLMYGNYENEKFFNGIKGYVSLGYNF